MSLHDELSTRMKTFYENIPKTKLMRRTPVAIRLDGKAFHTFTRHFKKPFDEVLIAAMQQTMKYLCENIQGCVLGYTQSDEITLILVDYKKLTTSAWFDYEVQKMCSISSSMATLEFNQSFQRCVDDCVRNNIPDYDQDGTYQPVSDEFLARIHSYDIAITKGAMFDARCFNVPKEEVTNLIYWRQLDAIRNSTQMVGQANFSNQELQNKSCNDIRNMLIVEKNTDWNDYPTTQKRGSCCIKQENIGWVIDNEIPIFKDDGRAYIEKLIWIGNE